MADDSTSTQLPGWFSWALAQGATSHFCDSSGVRLHYRGWGLDNHARPGLLFVHGFRAHARWWDFIAPFFIERFRVAAVDLSGMGDSGRRLDYGAGVVAQDILAVIENAQLAPAVVVAHSYGGSRALRACATRPEWVRHAVLLDSFVVYRDDPMPFDIPTAPRLYPDFETALRRFRLLPEQPRLAAVADHVARHSIHEVDGGWSWKFDPMLPPGGKREPDGQRLLRSIRTPVDFIRGEHSLVVSDERARDALRHLQNPGRYVVLPDAHHHLMLDQPLALIAALRALLA